MKLWMTAGTILTLATLSLGAGYFAINAPAHGAKTQKETSPTREVRTSVKVIQPRRGAMEHTTVQSGSVQAFETVHLYARASGYLKAQPVDIGDQVKRGQVLAVVDVPEVEKQVQKNEATVEQAQARVEQFKARIASANAELAATLASVTQAEANAKSAAAWVRFRNKQLGRMTDLFTLKSIDERLVDESRERYEAAVETENSAKASILTAKAQVAAGNAKIHQAEADFAEAKSQVKVAQAELERSQVLLSYAKVAAPFDGLITHRTLYPGDFVRSASEGGAGQPLLTVQRIDRMRVIVQIPDSEVPFTDPGDTALVELDALPGAKIPAKVSRVAHSEDPQTRQMRIEIDLPNTDAKIRQGMYGRVIITLENSAQLLSIPSACLVGKTDRGRGVVHVVRGGQVYPVRVRLGTDNGLRVAVQQGLSESDVVVYQPPSNLAEGTAVDVTPQTEE